MREQKGAVPSILGKEMKARIVIITDSETMARAINGYLQCVMGDAVEIWFWTYRDCGLKRPLYEQADLFILELFRGDVIGYRAEAIPTSEIFLNAGKRVLIVSGTCCADKVGNAVYWDLAAEEALHVAVQRVLDAPPPHASTLDPLKAAFKQYCRPAVSHHDQ